jgi:SAM-dependent methyltransferase
MVERSDWLLTLRRASEAQEDRLADEYDLRWGEIHPVHAEWVQRFLSLITPGGLVLDAACGTGKHLGMVLDSGRQVVGVDHSAAALARALAKHPGATTRHLDLQDLPFDNGFDGVMCVDAMEFVPPEDWPIVLGAFRRAARRDAWLYLTVELAPAAEVFALNQELADSGLPVVQGEVMWDQPDGYYHFHPDMDRVRKWIADAGFVIVDDLEGPWVTDDDGSYAYHHVLARAT